MRPPLYSIIYRLLPNISLRLLVSYIYSVYIYICSSLLWCLVRFLFLRLFASSLNERRCLGLIRREKKDSTPYIRWLLAGLPPFIINSDEGSSTGIAPKWHDIRAAHRASIRPNNIPNSTHTCWPTFSWWGGEQLVHLLHEANRKSNCFSLFVPLIRRPPMVLYTKKPTGKKRKEGRAEAEPISIGAAARNLWLIITILFPYSQHSTCCFISSIHSLSLIVCALPHRLYTLLLPRNFEKHMAWFYITSDDKKYGAAKLIFALCENIYEYVFF